MKKNHQTANYHDIYTPYEIGVCRLLKRMGQTHARYSEALVFQQLLEENIQATRRYLDTRARRSERSEIIDRLSALTLAVFGLSFNELSQLDFTGNEEPSQTILTEEAIDPEFGYDVYISYIEQEPDETWVWDTLMPRFEKEGLRVVVSGDVELAGIDRIESFSRGVKEAKRTLIVLSESYLANKWARTNDFIAQTIGIQEGTYRVLPVQIAPIDEKKLPVDISRMVIVNLTHSRHRKRRLNRLVQALKKPLPRM